MSDGTSGNFSVAAVRLVEAACSAQAGDCETAKKHIAHALAIIQSHPGGARLPGATRVSGARGALAEWQARRVVAHIDANLSGKVHIKDLAALLGFSTGHFCRVFKCTFGVPAHVYVTRRRIEFAQALMVTTSDTLSEIALRCGMGDQSHFTRSFRRLVGDTPYNWRRNRRGAINSR
jgi:AraC family transcriptional regulator